MDTELFNTCTYLPGEYIYLDILTSYHTHPKRLWHVMQTVSSKEKKNIINLLSAELPKVIMFNVINYPLILETHSERIAARVVSLESNGNSIFSSL